MRRSRLSSLRRGLVFAALLLVMAPASAEDYVDTDEGPTTDFSSAEKAGFVVPDTYQARKDPAEAKTVDERVASHVARRLNPDVPYGFGYALEDLNGDGFNDLILEMMLQYDPGEGVGIPVFVYLFDDGDWKLALEDQALAIGLRASSGGTKEIALIDDEPNGFRRFALKDGQYRQAR